MIHQLLNQWQCRLCWIKPACLGGLTFKTVAHAFAPAALRASLASRGKPCGLSPPHAAWRPLIPPNRLRRIGPASVPPRWTGAGEHAGACCGRLCGCVPSSTLAVPAITSRRTVHGQPARHRYGASTPRLKSGAARCGGCILACRRVVDLARVSGQAGEAFGRGCRVGPISFRSGSTQGVLVSL